jgi:hypothetical protein
MVMSTSDDIRQLESQLEAGKRDLREDASQISDKIEETKAKLSPMDFVRERVILVSGVALLLGFALGYLLGRRELPVEAVAQPAVEHLGKPIARRMLTTAGREAVTHAIRGQ